VGAAYHCLHKLGHNINYLYVDFDPPNYVTSKTTVPGPTIYLTNRIIPVDGGSRIELNFGRPEVPYSDEWVATAQANVQQTMSQLAQIINEAIAARKIPAAQSVEASTPKQDFGRPGVTEGRFGQIK
jgi:hypothetical protein